MSRTDKDTSGRIREMQLLKEGKIEHNHAYLGYGSSSTVTVEKYKSILKKNVKEVQEFTQFLEFECYDYKVTEYKLYSKSEEFGFGLSSVPNSLNPTYVQFEYKVEYSVTPYTAYCTDFEHYDEETGTDIRDGGRITCSVKVSKNSNSCRACGSNRCGLSQRSSSTKRRSNFKKLATAFNNGSSIDDLYDYSENEDYHNDRYLKSPSWASYC